MKRNEKVMLIIGLLLMGIGWGVLMFGEIASMFAKREVIEEYQVKAGDTFWSISEEYREKDCRNVYILEYKYELEQLNPQVKPGKLKVGDKLKVRYYVPVE